MVRRIFTRDPNGAGSWSKIAAPSTSIQCCGALEFFPHQNRLIFIDGDNGGCSYNPATNSWTQLWFGFNGGGTPILTMSALQQLGRVQQPWLSRLWRWRAMCYKMNAAGMITTISSPPFGSINIGTDVGCCSVAADPVTGHIVVIDGSRNVWNLNPTSGAWTNSRNRRSDLFQSCRSGFDLRADFRLRRHHVRQVRPYELMPRLSLQAWGGHAGH